MISKSAPHLKKGCQVFSEFSRGQARQSRQVFATLVSKNEEPLLEAHFSLWHFLQIFPMLHLLPYLVCLARYTISSLTSQPGWRGPTQDVRRRYHPDLLSTARPHDLPPQWTCELHSAPPHTPLHPTPLGSWKPSVPTQTSYPKECPNAKEQQL